MLQVGKYINLCLRQQKESEREIKITQENMFNVVFVGRSHLVLLGTQAQSDVL
jgi:hypothetical protein